MCSPATPTPPRTRASIALLATLAGALTCVAATSQQVATVDPAPFGRITAARETGFPFGYPQRAVVRVQEIHDGLQGTPRAITGIALRRRPAGTAPAIPVPAFDATVSLRLSHSPRSAATISATFADNRGPNPATLLDRASVSFPATEPLPGTAPEPFAFVLDGGGALAPFAYDGTAPLCIELVVEGHTNATPFTFELFEAERDHQGEVGIGCGGTEMATTIAPGPVITHTGTSLPPNAPVYFVAGFAPPGATVGGVALPWDLTGLGAPDCVLHLAPSLNVLDFADGTGSLTRDLDLSAIPPGLWYLAQFGAVQPGVNALGLVLTEAAVVAPAQPRTAGRVWSEDLTSPTGNAQPVFAWVVEVLVAAAP